MTNYQPRITYRQSAVAAQADIDLDPGAPKVDHWQSWGNAFASVGKAYQTYQDRQQEEQQDQEKQAYNDLTADFQAKLVQNTDAVAQGVYDAKQGALNERQLWLDFLSRGGTAKDAQQIVNGVSGNIIKAKADFARTYEQDWLKDEQDNKRKHAEELQKMNPYLFGGMTLQGALDKEAEIKKSDAYLRGIAKAHAENPDDQALNAQYRNATATSAQYSLGILVQGYQGKDMKSYTAADVSYIKDMLTGILQNNGVDSATARDQTTKAMESMGIGVDTEKLSKDELKTKADRLIEAARYQHLLDNPTLVSIEGLSSEMRQKIYNDPKYFGEFAEMANTVLDKSKLSTPRTDDKSVEAAGYLAQGVNRNTNIPSEKKVLANTNLLQSVNAKAMSIDNTPENAAQMYKIANDALEIADNSPVSKELRGTPEYQQAAFTVAEGVYKELKDSINADRVVFDGEKFAFREGKGIWDNVTSIGLWENSRVLNQLNKSYSRLDDASKEAFKVILSPTVYQEHEGVISQEGVDVFAKGGKVIDTIEGAVGGAISDLSHPSRLVKRALSGEYSPVSAFRNRQQQQPVTASASIHSSETIANPQMSYYDKLGYDIDMNREEKEFLMKEHPNWSTAMKQLDEEYADLKEKWLQYRQANGISDEDEEEETSRGYEDIVYEKAEQLGADPADIFAILHTESSGKADAVSHKGAKGYMQVMPETFKEVMPEGDIDDPEDNIEAGITYWLQMLERANGDKELARAYYNAGPNRVDSIREKHGKDWKKHLPKETKGYVKKVEAARKRYA